MDMTEHLDAIGFLGTGDHVHQALHGTVEAELQDKEGVCLQI